MFLSVVRAAVRRFRSIEDRHKQIQEALGRIEARQLRDLPAADIHGAEFKTYSQWGEDGILQHLIRHVRVSRNVFIEFGVEDYTEANTRFLLASSNWSGLVIDGSGSNIDSIKHDNIYWRHNLKAESAFITRENINDLIRDNGITGEIGVLSIDIDGNDYWVWEAITCISSAIVVIEYNARFGPDKAVTVPYDATFVRSNAHYSNIYYGASLAALCSLGKRKGYDFVGCNTAGNNAFFIQSGLRPATLPELTASQGFVPSQFRESRDQDGALSFLTQSQEAAILDELPLSVVP